MLRLKITGVVPKSLRHVPVHSIVTRDTIFGIHRGMYESKTMLFTSIDKTVAETLKDFISHEQQFGKSIGRAVETSTTDMLIEREFAIGTSIMPLSLMTMDIEDMEKVCWIHNFDMFVAHKLDYVGDGQISIFGYEFQTWEPPSRGITIKYMTDMLYRN